MDRPDILRISILQPALRSDDKKFNINTIVSMIKLHIRKEHVDIFFIPNDLFRVGSEAIPGETTEIFAEICRENNIFIAGGMAERVTWQGKAINTGFVVCPDGRTERMQSKFNLPREETERFAGAAISNVVDIGLLKLGCVMCNDIFYPEIARMVALNGAELIFVPSIMLGNMLKPLEAIFQARAIENQVYIVSANGIPFGTKESNVGKSGVYSPLWYELEPRRMGSEEGFTSFIIDMENVRELKASTVDNIEDYAKNNMLSSMKLQFEYRDCQT